MSTPLHGMISGSYTSDGNARVIPLRFEPDYFMLLNQSNFNSTANPGVVKRAWWIRGLASNAGYTVQNTNGAATDQSAFITTNGFRLINTATDALEAAQTGTAITAATPAVVTLNAHGYSVGDVVRLYNTTGMLQIAGMDFTVTAVGGANNFTLGYLPAAGFAAPATAVTARRVPFDPPDFAPKKRFITAITQAAQAVVTFSVTHGYQVGEIIGFRCTNDFGMSEIDGLYGQIVAINTTTNTVTVNIDTTAFTAFAFPTSATAAAGVTFPHAVPVGDQGQVLSGAISNDAFVGLRLGTTVVGANTDVVRWVAMKGVLA